jgi:carbon storage regulator
MGKTAGATGILPGRGIGAAFLASPADRSSGHHGQQGGIGAMLVLTRKSNQSIMIGDDIEVSVLAIMGEKVRIGIQAPRDVPVFRREVYLEIQQESAGEGAREEVDAALRDIGTEG